MKYTEKEYEKLMLLKNDLEQCIVGKWICFECPLKREGCRGERPSQARDALEKAINNLIE